MLEPHQSLLFVGGLHRSGTTPTARLLAEHPDVSGFAETGVTEDEGQHLQDVYPSAKAFGGVGRFAFNEAAHLTEASPLASPESAQRLWDQWSPHWDLSRSVLVEKSPPNLVMMRFLQALYPSAKFVVVMRHPAVVALSTSKWRRGTPLRNLLAHWVRAHEIFTADAPHVERLAVMKYEHLVRRPEPTLERLAGFLELSTPLPTGSLQTNRSDRYAEQWKALAEGGRWERYKFGRLCKEFEPQVQRFGYSLRDLDAAEEYSP